MARQPRIVIDVLNLNSVQSALRSYRVLRMSVDAMMAPLGFHGTISARDDRVQAVMDALAQVDHMEDCMADDMTNDSATHFCTECGAWWLCSSDGTWQLRSEYAGEDCCNNQPVHGNRNLVSVRHALQSIANICGAMS